MVFEFLYFVFAALGLSFLVFIHELGHYFAAKASGMRVEVFSIGFGRPICSWYRGPIKWQICWLLFGGYVRIAGMEKEGDKEPYEVADGFYGKKPWHRIFVALMGPIVNIAFAFILFSVIWGLGGRLKPYDQFTNVIGWVDPNSELYKEGVRAGDTITSFNHKEFTGFKDLIFHSVVKVDVASLSGEKIDYFQGTKAPYSYNLKPYNDPRSSDNEFQTIGILYPASCLIYDRFPKGQPNPIGEDSPFFQSGLSYGDRIVWVDGKLIFSYAQLMNVVNAPTTLLTVQRGEEKLLVNVARVEVADLQLSNYQKDEIDDWRYELRLQSGLKNLAFIPYFIDQSMTVKEAINFIDDDLIQEEKMAGAQKLLAGDKILAVDGKLVKYGYEFLAALQEKQVQVIVAKDQNRQIIPWNSNVNLFMQGVDFKALEEVIATGVSKGNLKKLAPIHPIVMKDKQNLSTKTMTARVLKKKTETKKSGSKEIRYNVLGSLELQDQYVEYNPNPLKVFVEVCQETYQTFFALITGSLSPKWMSGPVGIVRVIHDGWALGVKEALFWIAIVSLNLGIVNLLPIPVMDGGHICFSLYELITKKPIKAKMMERMVLPFVVLIVMLFIYITLQDVLRIFNM
ncbi:MAG: peptidase [Chlamydiae bacterium]|nr:peptidase [Chlamydiota bacterium]